MGLLTLLKNYRSNREINISKATVFCEPNLGKRKLYPTLSQKGNYQDIKLRMDLLAYSDGTKNLEFISKIINKPLNKVTKEYKLLKTRGLLT